MDGSGFQPLVVHPGVPGALPQADMDTGRWPFRFVGPSVSLALPFRWPFRSDGPSVSLAIRFVDRSVSTGPLSFLMSRPTDLADFVHPL
jgi:hypothetical protein